MEIIATRKKEEKPSYWLIQKIILASFAFIMGSVAFFGSDPSFLPVAIIGVVCFSIGLLLICCGIKTYIKDKFNNKLPDEVLFKHYNKLIIVDKEEITVNLIDIISIKARRYLKFQFVPYVADYGVLKIKTKSKTYILQNVDKVKEIEKWINGYIFTEQRRTDTSN